MANITNEFGDFMKYIQLHCGEHPKMRQTWYALERCYHVRKNKNRMEEYVGQSKDATVQNSMAMLSALLNETKSCLNVLLTIQDEVLQQQVISAFLDQINLEGDGIEEQLLPALVFVVLYRSGEMNTFPLSTKKKWPISTALHDCLLFNNDDLAEFVLRHYYQSKSIPFLLDNASAGEKNPFLFAIKEGADYWIDRLWLLYGDKRINNQDEQGKAALHHATYCGDMDLMVKLLQRPAINVNLPDNHGHTALHHIAAQNSPKEAGIKLLMKHPHTCVNIANNEGWTALHCAARYGSEAAVEALASDVDLNKRVPSGQTALAIAVEQGRVGKVRTLIQYRDAIRVNIPTNVGHTPLHLAADRGEVAIAQMLLQHPDINIYLIDNNGETALDIAEKRGHKAIVDLLLQHQNSHSLIKIIYENNKSALYFAGRISLYGGIVVAVSAFLFPVVISMAVVTIASVLVAGLGMALTGGVMAWLVPARSENALTAFEKENKQANDVSKNAGNAASLFDFFFSKETDQVAVNGRPNNGSSSVVLNQNPQQHSSRVSNNQSSHFHHQQPHSPSQSQSSQQNQNRYGRSH